jgi:Ca2+-binding EF-hand superfamily protein
MRIICKGETMTINGGSLWAASTHSYGSVQGQSGASGTAQADYSAVMQQAGNNLLTALDTDKSGTIDKAEFSQAAQALAQKTGNTYNADSAFSTIDSNSDGSISADELMSALKQAQSQQLSSHHHHKMDTTASSQQSSILTDSAQTADTTQITLSKMQTALLKRVMSAYNNSSATSSSTTIATA